MEPVTENEEEAPAAYAGGQVSTSVQLGVLGDRPTLDVPFNITGYTNKMMEDNQVATVDDVIVHDPSVSDQTLSLPYKILTRFKGSLPARFVM